MKSRLDNLELDGGNVLENRMRDKITPQPLGPNFLILGAPKSGTTSLFTYLKQNPQVYMSYPKETHFFDVAYERGMAYYWNTYFKSWQDEVAIGEACPTYLFLPYVPWRIKTALPQAKLIAILRHPVERAFSSWWMRYSQGIEKLPFKDAILDNLIQSKAGFSFEGQDGEKLWKAYRHWGGNHRTVQGRWYIELGYYAQQLLRYLVLFPSSQIKILFFNDLAQHPDALVADVWRFLGLNDECKLQDAEPQMTATPKAGLPLLRLARALRVQKLIPSKTKRWLSQRLAKHGRKPQMDAAVRALLLEHYYQHNRELERLVGRDLSHWDQ